MKYLQKAAHMRKTAYIVEILNQKTAQWTIKVTVMTMISLRLNTTKKKVQRTFLTQHHHMKIIQRKWNSQQR